MNLVAQIAMTAAASESHNVMGQTVIFGIIAAIIFAALALVTLSYRNVANRHSAKADAYAEKHGEDGHGH
ncbi:MAG TPA: hypothetical protein VN041_12940 [Microbacterium sp.]|jgi:hypothetical protein|uniref:4-hydroxybenzoate polyprenyltransferase n=1 Tax=Microbacterium arabinogalactanolyticum TaxID=69365 RepID=A0ABQ5NDE2_9MICO|nr:MULTISPECIES: hypothetical protein [Microbacterium]OJU41580.1 MAG: hypothetical protein BGN97_03915 [Microbacterium sp. 69-10]GLC83725.1 hypothetical protein MIAR_03130 [Microbacterium arabinogalactanolyticum]HWU29980.1 hypothetical protein [Microbacterium sp.]